MLSYDFNGGESGGGGAGADFPKELATEAQGAVCTQWRNFPGAFQVGSSSLQSEALMRSLCPEPDPNGSPQNPSAPTPPFSGGQCCDKTYKVTVNYTGADEVVNTFVVTLTGIISPVFFEDFPNNERRWFISTTSCNGSVVKHLMFQATGSLVDDYTVNVASVATNDGSVDECGDPPASYPPSPPVEDLPPLPPLSIPSPVAGAAPALLPIAFRALPILFRRLPSIPLDIGGIDVFIDLGGIHINLPNAGNDVDCGDCDLSPVLDAIAEVKADTSNLLQGVLSLEVDIASMRSVVNSIESKVSAIRNLVEDVQDTLADLPQIYIVRVVLTTLPANSKTQSGGANAPDIVYAGWFEFTVAGKPLPRQPIHFADQVFYHYGKADGYAFTLTNGAQGTASIIDV